jgi:predicted transglutaminase-like cysteine proteinase
MKTLQYAAVAIALLVAPTATPEADAGRSELAEAGTMRMPYNWLRFCLEYAPECEVAPTRPLVLKLTPDARVLLQTVNWVVNHHITYQSDFEHWGMIDRWNYAEDRFGDCEDFALVKRRELLAHGIPRSALLLTLVWAINGAHMVLTVKTDQGDLILDQQTDEIVRWWERPYLYGARQSQEDPNVWVWLDMPPMVVGQK